jgi:hypothetical protein
MGASRHGCPDFPKPEQSARRWPALAADAPPARWTEFFAGCFWLVYDDYFSSTELKSKPPRGSFKRERIASARRGRQSRSRPESTLRAFLERRVGVREQLACPKRAQFQRSARVERLPKTGREMAAGFPIANEFSLAFAGVIHVEAATVFLPSARIVDPRKGLLARGLAVVRRLARPKGGASLQGMSGSGRSHSR